MGWTSGEDIRDMFPFGEGAPRITSLRLSARMDEFKTIIRRALNHKIAEAIIAAHADMLKAGYLSAPFSAKVARVEVEGTIAMPYADITCKAINKEMRTIVAIGMKIEYNGSDIAVIKDVQDFMI